MQEAVSLSQLGNYLHTIIDEADIRVWVVAEIHSINVNKHCYIECVEKSELTGDVIARFKFNIWSNQASAILSKFRRETGKDLSSGMKIMAYAVIGYHPQYGMSGTIQAINSEFTIGDLERQRQETIRRLMADGVMDMNKQIELPEAIQRVAVISAETAAGYGDFCNQICGNMYGFSYDLKLYPAIVQGADAPASIIAALDAIASEDELPDVVVIIRGGGSRADLLCFDDYELASNVAQFPVPVVTGIGHERDNSIVDLVSHTRVKTPTAAAEFLIDHNLQLLNTLESLHDDVVTVARGRVEAVLNHVNQLSAYLEVASSNYIGNIDLKLRQMQFDLRQISAAYVARCERHLDHMSEVLKAVDPQDILQRGFTLTSTDGHRVKKASDVKAGSTLVTLTSDGKIVSVVR